MLLLQVKELLFQCAGTRGQGLALAGLVGTLSSHWLGGTPRQETAFVLARKNINGHTSVNSFNSCGYQCGLEGYLNPKG